MPRKGAVKNAPGRVPKRAMVLAAGLGTRLRPLTNKLPKPMVQVGERTLLDRTIDRLEDAGVERVVVNVHHLGHLIERHLGGRRSPEIRFSPEDDLLGSGGGVAKALPLLGQAAKFGIEGLDAGLQLSGFFDDSLRLLALARFHQAPDLTRKRIYIILIFLKFGLLLSPNPVQPQQLIDHLNVADAFYLQGPLHALRVFTNKLNVEHRLYAIK